MTNGDERYATMDEIRGFTRSFRAGTVVASGSAQRILGPFNLLPYARLSFTIQNRSFITLSGALIRINAAHDGNETDTSFTNPVQVAAGPDSGLWETLDASSFSNLAASGVKTVHFSGKCARWWDVIATNDVKDGSVSITVSGYSHASAF